MWGDQRVACRGSRVNSSALDVKSFCVCFSLLEVFTDFTHICPSLLAGHGKYVVSILVSTDFQCDGAWWLPLTGLSWKPHTFGSAYLMAPPSSGTIPHAYLLLMG